MKTILLSGYYGFGNFGDELILKNIALLFEKKKFGIYAVSGNVEFSKSIHKNINFIDRGDYEKITKIVNDSDCVILGGGGLIQDHYKVKISNLFKNPEIGITSYVNIPLLGKIYAKPALFIFQGVGPLFSKDAYHFTRFAFSLANFISVRDKGSETILKSLGFHNVNLSADPTLLFPLKLDALEKKEKPSIGISVRQWIYKNVEDKIIKAISDFLKELGKSYNIYFLSFQDYDEYDADSNIFQRIFERVGYEYDVIKFQDLSLDGFEKFIANLDYMIGMRLHSIVVSAKYNIPFISLSYDSKNINFAEELGLPELSLLPYSLSSNSLLRTFDYVLKNEDKIKTIMNEGTNKMISRLKGNENKIFAYIHHDLDSNIGQINLSNICNVSDKSSKKRC